MSRLIRMDHTGHSTLAEWTAGDETAYQEAVSAFRRELECGYIGVLDEGEGRAAHVRKLPLEGLVIMRRPIAGG